MMHIAEQPLYVDPLPTLGGLPRLRRSPFVRRGGFSFLEFEVALTLFGIAIIGLLPLLAMYSKGLQNLEQRCPYSGSVYVTPADDHWAGKLGAAARVTDSAPLPKTASPQLVLDDGDSGYAQGDAAWLLDSNSSAFQGDQQRHAQAPDGFPPSEASAATWTFTALVAGWYQVQATWTEAADQTNDARYTIYDDATALGTMSVNQQLAPSGITYEGRFWQSLGTWHLESGTLRVKLIGEAAAGYSVADGIRLIPIENNVQILSLDRSFDGEEATVRVSVEVLVPE